MRPYHVNPATLFRRMKRVLGFLLPVLVAATVRSEPLTESYAAQGILLLEHLSSAPFPHFLRAHGHEYDGKLYDAAGHYSDDTVAIFIPKGFSQNGRVDFVVHFHGWKNHVETVLRHYQLTEQLVASRRNAVLVVPQGPFDAPDSFGGKLEDSGGFARFINEVSERLQKNPVVKLKSFTVRNIILSGHSGGYQVISSILDRGGLSSHVKEVWLFDALYARTDKFLAWWDKSHGRLINIYTDHGGTKPETEQMMGMLKERGIPFLTSKESEITGDDLRRNRLIFMHSDLAHDDVVNEHHSFEQFLATSILGELPPSAGQSSSPNVPGDKSTPK
jgi:hypothetical protein